MRPSTTCSAYSTHNPVADSHIPGHSWRISLLPACRLRCVPGGSVRGNRYSFVRLRAKLARSSLPLWKNQIPVANAHADRSVPITAIPAGGAFRRLARRSQAAGTGLFFHHFFIGAVGEIHTSSSSPVSEASPSTSHGGVSSSCSS